MQQFRVPGLGYRLVLALAGAAVALTAGFAGVTFVRLIGLVVLGWPRARRGAPGARAAGPGQAGTTGGWAGPGSSSWRRAAWSPRPCCRW